MGSKISAVVQQAWDELNTAKKGRPTDEEIKERAIKLLTTEHDAELRRAGVNSAFRSVSRAKKIQASLTQLFLPGEYELALQGSFPLGDGTWVRVKDATLDDLRRREEIERANMEAVVAEHQQTVEFIEVIEDYFETDKSTCKEAIQLYFKAQEQAALEAA